jgi:hypothetical protein
MEEKDLVVEETNENVDTQTTEENVEGIELTDTPSNEETEEVDKKYTQEEVDGIVEKRLARERAKLERDYNKELQRYKRTEEILNAGLGTDNIEDANKRMVAYYENEGIKIPDSSKSNLTQRQIEILGTAEADDIIQAGEEREELNRLLQIDVKDMTPTEKVIYKKLYEKVTDNDRRQELIKEGIDISILDNKDFQNFEKQFKKETNLNDIVKYYTSLNPVEEPKKIGSMKSESVKTKDYYTPEEVQKLTQEDWDKPGVFEKVLASQAKWK